MQSSGRILVVDDDAGTREVLANILCRRGYDVETAADGFKALSKIPAFNPELILCDVKMPGLDGMGLLEKARASDLKSLFVLLTADSAVATAVSAIKYGAADYLVKPIDMEHLQVVVQREIQRYRLRAEANTVCLPLPERRGLSNIIGVHSPLMQPLCNTIQMVAPSSASVLITGESGTGKELVATAIHDLSPRRGGHLIKVHCAALSESLIESELFGHERGAFTGAAARREGRFEQANHGTLFLDEVGEISASVQVKLLRFLQEHELERVGGNETVKVDVRIVAATNRDLLKDAREGRFREDLYYRLAVVSLCTLPLRAMRSNIAAIAMHFLKRFALQNRKPVTGFSDEALALLARHPWPGNVRELENAVERGVLCCRSELVDAEDLGVALAPAASKETPRIPGATLAELEKFAILKTLEQTGGSTTRAAAILGISPRKIQYRLQEYMGQSAALEPASGYLRTAY